MTEARFLELIEPLQIRMFRLAYSMLGMEEDARDTVQDAIVKLWEQRARLTGIGNTEAWCIRVTKNLVLDRIKYNSYRKTERIEKQEEKTFETAEVDLKERVQIVKKLIDQLPERSKILIHLRDVEGFGYDEIAEIMELTTGEVKIGIYRARQAIRKKFKP